VISDDIFDILFISNFEIKFLKKEDPTNELGLRILLKNLVSKRRMFGEYGGVGPKYVWTKFFHYKHYSQEFLLSCSIV